MNTFGVADGPAGISTPSSTSNNDDVGATDGGVVTASDATGEVGTQTTQAGTDSGTGGLTTASATGETTTIGTTTTGTTTGAASTGEATTGCMPLEWFFDVDGDGYGGPMSTKSCESPGPNYQPESLDCDDIKPAVNPDATEECDGIDNDCDGGIDEYPANAMLACNGCTALLGATSTYYFCDAPTRTWDDARAHCMTLLGDLTTLNDDAEVNFINAMLPELGQWWIGLSDSAIEGQFVWIGKDGLGAVPWANGEPDNDDFDQQSPADCVLMSVMGWFDQPCGDLRRFICEAPPAI